MITGIVIVSYNSARYLGSCLEAALTHCDRVVVVDNASQDDSQEIARAFPNVRLIANAENRGFAAAVNQGVRALDTDLILLLNPDAILQTSIDALITTCSEPGVVAAGGRLIDAAGDPQTGFCLRRFPTPTTLAFEALGFNRIWPSNPVNRRYRCLDLDLLRPQAVEQPAGAFLMIRREAWERLGGFDESFWPAWFEEVDFLKRAHSTRGAIRYTPEAAAIHYGAHSFASVAKADTRVYWYHNLIRFAAKHFQPLAFRVVSAAVMAGVSARAVVDALTRSGPGAAGGFARPFRIAARSLVCGKAPGRNSNGESSTRTDLSNSHSHGL
jgi:GT2 family glycosyltransferase